MTKLFLLPVIATLILLSGCVTVHSDLSKLKKSDYSTLYTDTNLELSVFTGFEGAGGLLELVTDKAIKSDFRKRIQPLQADFAELDLDALLRESLLSSPIAQFSNPPALVNRTPENSSAKPEALIGLDVQFLENLKFASVHLSLMLDADTDATFARYYIYNIKGPVGTEVRMIGDCDAPVPLNCREATFVSAQDWMAESRLTDQTRTAIPILVNLMKRDMAGEFTGKLTKRDSTWVKHATGFTARVLETTGDHWITWAPGLEVGVGGGTALFYITEDNMGETL